MDISKTSSKELNFWLSRFVMEARRGDGTEYPSNTLYNIIAAIQRHLRQVCDRPEISFFDKTSIVFTGLRSTIDARMKELASKGKGIVKHTDNLTAEDEIRMWDTDTFSKTTAKGLSNAIFFYNCKIFGFRGMSEHRNADAEQYTIHTDAEGMKTLKYQERVSKTIQGGLAQRKLQPKCIVQHSDPTNPRDVVGLFEVYLNLIPASGPLYRRPINFYKGPPKFGSQPVGVNTLAKYMQSIFAEANIQTDGRNITNHSGRVFCCSSLYASGFSEQEIMARSGHRSEAVRQYKRPSNQLLTDVSNSLQPPKKQIKEDSLQCVNNADSKENVNPTTKPVLKPNTTPAVDEDAVLEIVVPSCIKCVVLKKGDQNIKITL